MIEHPFVALGCGPQSPTECLEDGLGNMMGIATTQIVDMQGCLGMIDKALEELADQIDIEPADHRPGIIGMVFQSRPTGEVDHDP